MSTSIKIERTELFLQQIWKFGLPSLLYESCDRDPKIPQWIFTFKVSHKIANGLGLQKLIIGAQWDSEIPACGLFHLSPVYDGTPRETVAEIAHLLNSQDKRKTQLIPVYLNYRPALMRRLWCDLSDIDAEDLDLDPECELRLKDGMTEFSKEFIADLFVLQDFAPGLIPTGKTV